MENKITTICITELLLNFNQTIACLAKKAENINLAWQEKRAYDEWDTVTQVIFNTFVKFPIEWGIYSDHKVDVLLPDYDVCYNDYSGYSYFVCTQKDLPEDTYVFHSFDTKINPMDIVRVLKIDTNEKVSSRDFFEIPLEKAEFILFYKVAENIMKTIKELTLVQDKY